MRKLTILLVSFVFLQAANAQTILYGLEIDVYGKIVFSQGEANYTSEIRNPVSVICEGEDMYSGDWRNAKYDYLTIVAYPDETWTMPNRNDPSRVNDTTVESNYSLWENGTTIFFDTSVISYVTFYPTDSLPEYSAAQPETIQTQKMFEDEIVGLELTEERVAMLKTKLREYVNLYYGKTEPYEARLNLWSELSREDSVVEKTAVYDYLVDKLVFYNYEGGKLNSAIGYYYDFGIEFDTLRYDPAGNLVYFSRESIGGTRNEYYMEYNAQKQVSKVSGHYSSVGNTDEESYIYPTIEVNKFEYDAHGKIKAKLFYHEDGTWGRCTFTDRPFDPAEL